MLEQFNYTPDIYAVLYGTLRGSFKSHSPISACDINPFGTELLFVFRRNINMCYFQLCVGYFVIVFLLF